MITRRITKPVWSWLFLMVVSTHCTTSYHAAVMAAAMRPAAANTIQAADALSTRVSPIVPTLAPLTTNLDARVVQSAVGQRHAIRPVTVSGIVDALNPYEFAWYAQASQHYLQNVLWIPGWALANIRIRLGRVRPAFSQPHTRSIPRIHRFQMFQHVVDLFTAFRWLQVRQDQWARHIQTLYSHRPIEVSWNTELATTCHSQAIISPAIKFLLPILSPYVARGLVVDLDHAGWGFRSASLQQALTQSDHYHLIRFTRPSAIEPLTLALIAPVAMTADLPSAMPIAAAKRYHPSTADFPVDKLTQYKPDDPGAFPKLPPYAQFESIAQQYRKKGSRETHAVWPVRDGRNRVYELFTSDREDLYKITIQTGDQRVTPYAPGYCPTHNWGNHMIPGSLGWLDPQVANINSEMVAEEELICNMRIPLCDRSISLRARHTSTLGRYVDSSIRNGVRGVINERIWTRQYVAGHRTDVMRVRYAHVGHEHTPLPGSPSGDVLQELGLLLTSGESTTTDRADELQASGVTLRVNQVAEPVRTAQQEIGRNILQLGRTMVTEGTIDQVIPWCTLIGAAYPPAVIPVQFAHLDRAPGYCKLVYLAIPPRGNAKAVDAHLAPLSVMGAQSTHSTIRLTRRIRDGLTQLYGVPTPPTLEGLDFYTNEHQPSIMWSDYLDNQQVTLAVSNMTPPELMPRFPTDIVGPVPTVGDYIRHIQQHQKRRGARLQLIERHMAQFTDTSLYTYSQFFNAPYRYQAYREMMATDVIRRADRVYTSNGALLTFSIPIVQISHKFKNLVDTIKAMPDDTRRRFGRVSISRRNTADGPLVLHCAIPMRASMYVIPFTKMIPQGVLLPVNGTPKERARVEHDRVYNAMMAQQIAEQDLQLAAEDRQAGRLQRVFQNLHQYDEIQCRLGEGAAVICNSAAGVAATVNTTTWRSDMPNDVLTGQAPGTLLMHSGLPRILRHVRQERPGVAAVVPANTDAMQQHVPANAVSPHGLTEQDDLTEQDSLTEQGDLTKQAVLNLEATITPQSCRAAVRTIAALRCRPIQAGQTEIIPTRTADVQGGAIPFSDVYGSVKVIDMAAAITRLQPTTTGSGTEVDSLCRCLPQVESDSEEATAFEEYAMAIVQLLNDVMEMPQDSDAYKQVVSTARISLPLRLPVRDLRLNLNAGVRTADLPEAHTIFRQGCLVGAGGLRRLLARYKRTGQVPLIESAEDICTTNPMAFTGAVDMLCQNPSVTRVSARAPGVNPRTIRVVNRAARIRARSR